jgi:hypothetical protein
MAPAISGPDAIDMRVVDGSLKLKISNTGPGDLVVSAAFTMKEIVAKIGAAAGRQRIGRLTLMCHGFAMMAHGDVNPDTGEKLRLPAGGSKLVCKVYGGYGLELGSEDLNLTTVSAWSAMKGRFSADGIIIIYGCAAADTGPTHTLSGGRVLTGDGPALMRALSAAAGVPVVAAIYLQNLDQNWYLGTVDRGEFVGPTYLFKPDGTQIQNVASY